MMSPRQLESEQPGMIPVTDHSLGSSDGKRKETPESKLAMLLFYLLYETSLNIRNKSY